MISFPENPPFAADPCCGACNTLWHEHKGLAATCHDLQVQKALFKELSDAHAKLLADFVDYKQRNPPKTPTPPLPQ
jgi:hypothetical protein